MSIARTLQVRAATTVVVLGRPSGVDLDFPGDCLVVSDEGMAAEADAVICFVVKVEDLDTAAGAAITAALDDRLAWIAYPKAHQLGSDLNRDILAARVMERGAQPVRSVSIDSVWSGLRFRPR